jgi:hypothetical protein
MMLDIVVGLKIALNMGLMGWEIQRGKRKLEGKLK